MFKQNELLKTAMRSFPGSFVNHSNELILIPKTNLYFSLENITSEIEFKCKVLEWCSRDASKAMPCRKDWLNKIYWDDVRDGVNQTLGTNFTHENMMIIYEKLGNQVNRNLTMKFIESSFDMNTLRGDEE